MTENREETLSRIKEALKEVTADTTHEKMAEVKKRFKETIKDADPMLIAAAEAELVKDGAGIKDLMKACGAHMELFKDAIRNPDLKVPEGHPVSRFQEDHKNILDLMEKLVDTVNKAEKAGDYESASGYLRKAEAIMGLLMDAENHNVRQENTLFPVLEKHGIEQPPAIMWYEHNEMKEMKKRIIEEIKRVNEGNFVESAGVLRQQAVLLFEKFAAHTQKEENILYVTALKNINEEEWKDIKEECDNLGYFKPE